ncbi:hypothetical protein Ancab_006978 [Ancistrocladus abbreviatus]
MEEVWKDISVSSFYPSTTPNSTSQSRHSSLHSSFILQDFFSPQSKRDPPTDKNSFANTSTNCPFSSLLPSPPATCLSLKSGQLESESSTPFLSSLNYGFEGLGSSGRFCSKRRISEENDGSGDRRHKRMMKNRESAVRSRARRQAYTFELERERADLMEENEKLRRKLNEKLCFAAAAVEVPKKANSI